VTLSWSDKIGRAPAERAAAGMGRDELGSYAPELVVVLPALFILVALFFQIVLWALASHAVQAAASNGGSAARSWGGTPAGGISVARSELSSIADGLVLSPSISAAILPGAEEVLTVSGSVPSVFPGLHLTAGASSIGPLQTFRSSG
jgi:predicted metal-binding membrane protein